jgi:hypothetical protein
MLIGEKMSKKHSENKNISHDTLIDLLRGAYFALDGLWFLVVEKKYGFEDACEVDIEVWSKFASIMARRVKKHLNIEGQDIPSVLASLKVFFQLEKWGHEVTVENEAEGAVRITKCPWYDYLIKAKREKVIEKLCPPLCLRIFNSWAKEFNPNINVTMPKPIPNCEIFLQLTRK